MNIVKHFIVLNIVTIFIVVDMYKDPWDSIMRIVIIVGAVCSIEIAKYYWNKRND